MRNRIKGLLILIIGLLFPFFARAENIVLKSGKSVEGKLIEKTDKYIKIDFCGISLTYFYNEIESIDGENPVPNKATQAETSKEQIEQVKPDIQLSAENPNLSINASKKKNNRSPVYIFLMFDTAKKAAQDENKPMVFLFTDMSPRCPIARRAISDTVRAFQDIGILVNLKPEQLSSAPKLVQDVLISGKAGNMLPVTIITDSKVTKVISTIPSSNNSQARQDLFRKAKAEINKYNSNN